MFFFFSFFYGAAKETEPVDFATPGTVWVAQGFATQNPKTDGEGAKAIAATRKAESTRRTWSPTSALRSRRLAGLPREWSWWL